MKLTASGVTRLGGVDDVALVLAVLVVDEHDRLARLEVFQHVGDRGERHTPDSSRVVQRSTYIAVQCIMAGMKLAKDLVAASAGPLVLSILAAGRDLRLRHHPARPRAVRRARRVDRRHALPRPAPLEAQGAITARWRVADNGRKRKYYALKTTGRRVLAEHRQQWELVNGMLATAWG